MERWEMEERRQWRNGMLPERRWKGEEESGRRKKREREVWEMGEGRYRGEERIIEIKKRKIESPKIKRKKTGQLIFIFFLFWFFIFILLFPAQQLMIENDPPPLLVGAQSNPRTDAHRLMWYQTVYNIRVYTCVQSNYSTIHLYTLWKYDSSTIKYGKKRIPAMANAQE